MALLRSTLVVGMMTFASRILGFARDVVIAHGFGAGSGADAFFVAFKIPNFLRRMFGEGAFSQAFVPVLSEYKANRSKQDVRLLVDRVAGTLAGVLLILTIVGVVAAPILITLFAPGFIGSDDRFDLAVSMLRLTFPYLFFICLTALAAGVLNTYGRFAIPAFTPVFLNLSMIAAALWLAPWMDEPVMALAAGVFVGGVVQLGFQVPFLLRIGLLPRPRVARDDEGVRRILRLMGPAVFGVSVTQINLLIDTMIASFLVTGSVSWLYYSDRLVEFPLGVFGIALATVILPNLSEKHTKGSAEAFSQTLDWALRWVVVIGSPAALGLALMAQPMLCTLFQYGEFVGHDVQMAGRSLMAYSLGLVGFTLIKIFAPGYFARQDTRTPVRIGVIAMFTNIALNCVLVFPLAHAGLALATSLAACLNATLLYRGLRRQGVYRPSSGWQVLCLRVLGANLAMAALLWIGVSDLEQWLVWGAWQRAWHLVAWLSAAAAVYFVSLALFGLRWRHVAATPSKS